ncbi:hypothetical protein Hanom_Chr12g01075371 [Helianthus anomalus]
MQHNMQNTRWIDQRDAQKREYDHYGSCHTFIESFTCHKNMHFSCGIIGC